MSLLVILNALIHRRPRPSPRPSPVPTVGPAVAAINRARVAAGRAPLADDPALEVSASTWAALLAARMFLDHGDFRSRLSSVHPGAAIGEDIAEGYGSADAAVAGWMGHPPHRAILLGDFDSAGMASAGDTRGTLYWVADFAKVNR